MFAVEISQPGGPEVLIITERPCPTPNHNEVLIKVAAAGVNRPDVLQRKGLYPPPAGACDLPGLEVAGEIIEGDLSQSCFSKGDKVCALLTGGGYAQYCLAPISQCLPIPNGLTECQAAALPENYFTVWSNVFEQGQLSKNESLLVHGGASGIGTTAIQLAHVLGHKVYTTVGSDAKVQAVKALGADKAINYLTQDYVKEILKVTAGQGVNVVLDMVAGDYINRNIQCLAQSGRIMIIALLGGSRSNIDCAAVLRRHLTIAGSTLRSRSINYKAKLAQRLHEKVWPLLETGEIKPIIYATFKLSEAAMAHALIESGQHIGKIVLTL